VNKTDAAVEWRHNVAAVVLSRPERLNAFTLTMIDACSEALVELRDNDKCRVIILTGKVRGFCSGADIDEITDVGPAAKKALLSQRIHRIPLLLEGLYKPTIAMINGPVFGAGLDMALMCDLRIAADTARPGSAYVKLGMVPRNGGTFFLPRVIDSVSSQLAVIQETPASKEALRAFRERWRSRTTDERGTTE
jgi:enoyl-CoA hydratase/carnithine racemase